jgi:hypothetical protein
LFAGEPDRYDLMYKFLDYPLGEDTPHRSGIFSDIEELVLELKDHEESFLNYEYKADHHETFTVDPTKVSRLGVVDDIPF